MNIQQKLDLTWFCGDLNKTVTFRSYFGKLLEHLWAEGEGFSGKRPFGNSGWEYDVYRAMADHRLITGESDGEDDWLSYDEEAGSILAFKMIKAMTAKPKPATGAQASVPRDGEAPATEPKGDRS